MVAGVAVMSRYSAPPATFDVTCEGVTSRWLGKERAFRLEVSWAEETAAKADRLLATMQQKPVVELASIALAFILARRLLALGQLDLNDYGERADYRSPGAQCVLEVSGTEDISELGRRHSTTPTAGVPASSCVPFRPRDIASGSHDMARRRHKWRKRSPNRTHRR